VTASEVDKQLTCRSGPESLACSSSSLWSLPDPPVNDTNTSR